MELRVVQAVIFLEPMEYLIYPISLKLPKQSWQDCKPMSAADEQSEVINIFTDYASVYALES